MENFKDNDYFEGLEVLPIEEKQGSSEVDGVHIIGKVAGRFFVPDGVSRNKRFYSRSLWEKVLSKDKTKELLSKRLMFGAFSHEQTLNDKSIGEGKSSHIVSKLEIGADGFGYGEALILNTPSGRILNTILNAGSKLSVSSRAVGSFRGRTPDNDAIVDENTYDFSTFDFVINPGFLEANPQLAESLNNLDNEEEYTMDVNKELLEQLTKLRLDFSSLEAANQQLRSDLIESNSKLDEANETLKDYVVKSEELAKFKTIGSFEEIKEKCEMLEGYKAVADNPEQISEANNNSATVISSYTELGTVDELNSIMESLNSYLEVGSIEVVKNAVELIEKYKELGSVEELNLVIEKLTEIHEKNEESRKEKFCKELAEQFSCSMKSVQILVEKGLSEEEIKEILDSVKTKAKNEGWVADDNKEEKTEVEEKTHYKETKANSLIESLTKGTNWGTLRS